MSVCSQPISPDLLDRSILMKLCMHNFHSSISRKICNIFLSFIFFFASGSNRRRPRMRVIEKRFYWNSVCIMHDKNRKKIEKHSLLKRKLLIAKMEPFFSFVYKKETYQLFFKILWRVFRHFTFVCSALLFVKQPLKLSNC